MGTNLSIHKIKIRETDGYITEEREIDWFFKHVGDDEFLQGVNMHWHTNSTAYNEERGYCRPHSFAQAFGFIVSKKFVGGEWTTRYFFHLLRQLQKDKDLYVSYDN